MALTFTITSGYVLGASEAVTNDKLNAMLSLAYVTAIAGTLDTAQIADAAVTANKLASTLDLSTKTITFPTTARPKTGITAASTVPDFIGQVGLTSANLVYVAYGVAAGNWRAVDDALALSIATQWNADGTNFPIKTMPAAADWLLVEDSAASFAKKKVAFSAFGPKTSVVKASTVPDYIGQIGVNAGATEFYIAHGVSAGNWHTITYT